jgi:hypothetical protein
MCNRLVLGLWLVLIPAVCGAQGAAGAGRKPNDQVTLNVNVKCAAAVHWEDQDTAYDDQLQIIITETNVYRVITWNDDIADLEQLSRQTQFSAAGLGTMVVPGAPPHKWTYLVEHQPTTPVCGVELSGDGIHGRVYVVDPTGWVAMQPKEEMGMAVGVAGMTFSEATSSFADVTGNPTDLQQALKFTIPQNVKTAQVTGQGGHHYIYADKGGGDITVGYTVTVGPPSNVDAVIKPQGDYKGWQPAASTTQGRAGNSIAFNVELKDKKTGEPPNDKTARFEFKLLDTTKEPGSCMNSPWADTEPDLKILQANNTQLASVGGDGQSAKSHDGLTSCPITVSCFDGGACGRLEVVAHLDDDTQVTAHMEDGSTQVSLPYDLDGNRIADAWEQQNDVVGKDAASDDDDQPHGNFFNGDGLTLWEEYRGFLQETKHIRTDPRKKDLFICDTMGGRVKAGIARFEALTKIAVHARLTRDELSDGRVINRNHAQGPHVVDQHGLLTWPSTGTGSCEAIGGPGTPKTCREVRLDTAIGDTQQGRGSGGAKTYPKFIPFVVHELLHCCNVWHHGECDAQVWWRAETVGGTTSIYEYGSKEDVGKPDRGQVVTVLDERNGHTFVPTDPYWATAHYVWLGMHQGQHSGCEDCVMRYCCSDAYGSGLVRYYLQWFGREPVGQNICTNAVGTGVNDNGRKPKSRYGDADEENRRGNCTDQICVNDRYEPPGAEGP